jgi:hypothetical protein
MVRTSGFFVWSVLCSAQTLEHIRDPNAHAWFVYTGDHALKGRWALYADLQLRRAEFGLATQQVLLRNGLTYTLTPNVRLTSGYAWIYTGRYGDFPVARAFGEHRAYQQVSIRHPLPHVIFEHRYRLEQRWLQDFSRGLSHFWRYQNRFRYQIKADVPIRKSEKWYVFGGDELLLGFGVNKGAGMFDQNRAFAGIGYFFSPKNKVEVGYMNQFLQQRNGIIDESNHTMRVVFYSSVPLFSR